MFWLHFTTFYAYVKYLWRTALFSDYAGEVKYINATQWYNKYMENFLKKFNLHNLSKKQWVFFAGFFVTGIIFWLYLFMIFSLHSSIILGGIIGIFWFCFAGIGMLFLDNRLLFIAYGILSILALILFGFRSFNIIGIIIFLV